MRVTERLMKAGSFSLSLIPDTPGSVLSEIRESLGFTGDTTSWGSVDGHIVVTPAHMPTSSVSLSVATYTGRLMANDSLRAFSGKGLATWLGAEQTPSAFKTTKHTYSAKTLSELIDNIFTSGRGGGMSKGTVTSPAGTKTVRWAFTTSIEFLDHISFIHGTQWRINPDGSLDAAVPGTLFVDTPEVMIVNRDLTAGGGSATVLSGEVTNAQIDATHVVAEVRAYGEGEGSASITSTTSSASGTPLYNFGGSAFDARIPLDLSSEGNTSELTDAGDESLALYETPRFSFDVRVDADRVRDHIEPGDSIHVADEQSGLVDTSNPVPLHGGSVFPIKVKVQRMTWPVTRGHGVYLRRHAGTETFMDLTPYIEWPDAGTDLEVGDGTGEPDAEFLLGHARFWPSLVERLLR